MSSWLDCCKTCTCHTVCWHSLYLQTDAWVHIFFTACIYDYAYHQEYNCNTLINTMFTRYKILNVDPTSCKPSAQKW